MVEALTVKVELLNDMKRQKRHLDARLDECEEKLSTLTDECALMSSNVNWNSNRIQNLESKQDDVRHDEFVDVADVADVQMRVQEPDEEGEDDDSDDAVIVNGASNVGGHQ